MKEEETLPIFGDKDYHRHAQKALPILVRQALANSRIFYSDLAVELGMVNPRNLNNVLGAIGETLQKLSEQLSIDIPPIQCLVINRHELLPGVGVSFFSLDLSYFNKLPVHEKRQVVARETQKIFAFQDWGLVLNFLGLEFDVPNISNELAKASHRLGGGGESEHHKRLKEFVANNPDAIGLSSSFCKGKTEFCLPSGDKLDVFFESRKEIVAVEVKSCISDDSDVARGMFQCVKYHAVLNAWISVTRAVNFENRIQPEIKCLLVLESRLPFSLISLKNMLGISVFEALSIR